MISFYILYLYKYLIFNLFVSFHYFISFHSISFHSIAFLKQSLKQNPGQTQKARTPPHRPGSPRTSTAAGWVISATSAPRLKPRQRSPSSGSARTARQELLSGISGLKAGLMIFRGGFGSSSRRCWGSGAAESAPGGSSPADESGLGYF